ncbi:MAG: hypothetical protein ACYT04_34255 [Nostoc sp.]
MHLDEIELLQEQKELLDDLFAEIMEHIVLERLLKKVKRVKLSAAKLFSKFWTVKDEYRFHKKL